MFLFVTTAPDNFVILLLRCTIIPSPETNTSVQTLQAEYFHQTSIMGPDDRKLRKDYGMLCGIQRKQSSSSSSNDTEPDRDDSAMIPERTDQTNRPQSLTLPFENRERESHLVSEEEFDRIARDAQSENPLPTIPLRFGPELSEGALRRSISTAPRSRYSFLPSQSRPLSEDIGKTLHSISTSRSGLTSSNRHAL